MKILIIEDNPVLSKNLSKFLEMKWFKTKKASSCELAQSFLDEEKFHLILLDLNLPGIDGDQFLVHLREYENIPVIIMTSRSTNEDIVEWFHIWADDYITKPFDFDVLLARINNVFKKGSLIKKQDLVLWNIKVDFNQKKIYKDENEVDLSTLEIDLMIYLSRNKGKVLTRSEIYENVWWDFDNYMFSRVIDIYIWNLRKKIWKDIILTKIWQWYYIK